MADESVSKKKTMLGEKGLAKLVSLILKELGEGSGGDESKGDYLPLTGGSLTGNLEILAELMVAGPVDLENTVIIRNTLRIMNDADMEALNAKFDGDVRINGQATFCGDTYIDTSGHIHLPSGVEIY